MLSMRPAVLSALIFAGAACAPAADRSTAPPKPPPTRAAAVVSSAAPAGASPVGTPTPVTGVPLTIGEITYNSHDVRNVAGVATRKLDAGDFYFKGTFLQGRPGQKLTLQIRNTGKDTHNFSIPAQEVDRDIPTGGQRVEVEVTFPESGALRFFCKLHESRGMNGQLLAGKIEPQPVAGAAPQAGG